MQDFMTAVALITDSLYDNEEFLIRGMVYILDSTGLSSDHLQIVPIHKFIKIAKNGEKCIVGRHKGFHVVNDYYALTFLINLVLKHAPEKIRERMKFYSSFDQLNVVKKSSMPLVSYCKL